MKNGSKCVPAESTGRAWPGVPNFNDRVLALSSDIDEDALVFDLILRNRLNGVDQEGSENLTEAGFVAELSLRIACTTRSTRVLISTPAIEVTVSKASESISIRSSPMTRHAAKFPNDFTNALEAGMQSRRLPLDARLLDSCEAVILRPRFPAS